MCRLPAAFSSQTKILHKKSTRDDHVQRKDAFIICRQALQNDEDPLPKHTALPSKKMQSKPRNAEQGRADTERE